ncbi:MAG: hypothetical protein IJ111_10385, partial [Eggerthellaceae bacterium]|nr:hypothetical protein [Eggerthellaceae bacterium]
MGTRATIGFVPGSQVGANCCTRETRIRLLYHAGAVLIAVALFICFALVPRAWADECPAGGQHEYVAELVEQATAESDGSRTFTCIKCGYAYTQSIPKTGHDWGPWIQDVSPTCTSEGHEYRECRQHPDNPHYEDRIVPMLSSDGRHAWVEQSREEPTSASSGRVSYVCGVCGAQYEEVLPAIQAEP